MKSKFTSRTSWREKLERVQESKIVDIPPKMQKRFGKGKMLIPKPLDVDALIRKIKKGKLVTQSEIRNTGIFVRIISEASEEDFENGRKDNTPYWRVIRDDGSLIEKFPGGVERQAEYLKKENHTIEKMKNKKLLFVKDFEKNLTIRRGGL